MLLPLMAPCHGTVSLSLSTPASFRLPPCEKRKMAVDVEAVVDRKQVFVSVCSDSLSSVPYVLTLLLQCKDSMARDCASIHNLHFAPLLLLSAVQLPPPPPLLCLLLQLLLPLSLIPLRLRLIGLLHPLCYLFFRHARHIPSRLRRRL